MQTNCLDAAAVAAACSRTRAMLFCTPAAATARRRGAYADTACRRGAYADTACRRGAYALAVNYRVGDANAAAAAAGRPSLRVFAHELEEAAAVACLLLLCKL